MKRTPIKKRRTKPRRGRVVDKPYREWILKQPCIVTGAMTRGYDPGFIHPNQITAHHVRRLGEPKNDRRTVPLTARLHMLTHCPPKCICVEHSRKQFEEAYHVDLEAEIVLLNERYEQERVL